MSPQEILQLKNEVDVLRNMVLALIKTDRYTFQKGAQFFDGRNIAFGLTTGTKLGTLGGAAGQKIGFWNVTPVVQPVRPTDAASIITTGTLIGIWR